MSQGLPDRRLQPGRYAAIDIGTNSALLLVADLERDGSLRPVCERGRITRLGEKTAASRTLAPAAMSRTLAAVSEYVEEVRRSSAQCTAIVGTAVLREAENGPEFCQMVRARCGLFCAANFDPSIAAVSTMLIVAAVVAALTLERLVGLRTVVGA